MFEDLIRTLENLDGRKVSVEIPADPEGYFDRACPSESCLFEFKIHEDDWKDKVRDEEVFCPFCRHGAPSDQWWTERQLEHARQAAFGQVKGDINQAMRRDADRWNRSATASYASRCPWTTSPGTLRFLRQQQSRWR